ncbi:MAG: chromate resistance protein [Candidatus Omnitrophica bacterium]|nr:chromate resistance protein [Candidatus Omnitrophota bacterium]
MRKVAGLLVCLLAASAGEAAQQPHVYSTRDVLEFDACASAWLIKRFVDPQARFTFHPSGALITDGIPFNTPEAAWRTTQTMTTYELILRDAHLRDAALIRLGEMVHEIELTYSRSFNTEASALNERILALTKQEPDPAKALEQSFIVLDGVYRALQQRPQGSS